MVILQRSYDSVSRDPGQNMEARNSAGGPQLEHTLAAVNSDDFVYKSCEHSCIKKHIKSRTRSSDEYQEGCLVTHSFLLSLLGLTEGHVMAEETQPPVRRARIGIYSVRRSVCSMMVEKGKMKNRSSEPLDTW